MILEDDILKFSYKNKQFYAPIYNLWDIGITPPKTVTFSKLNIKSEKFSPNYFTIHLTDMCNLRCSYCFEGEKNNNKMSVSTIESFIKFILSLKIKEVYIRLFGGEPLIDFSLLKEFVLRVNDKLKKYNIEVHYNIFTNGTLLSNEIIEFIKLNNIYVFLSLDACKEIHNKNRITHGGRGTFDLVIKNYKLLKAEIGESNIMVRSIMDLSHTNYSLVNLMDSLYNLGIKLASFEIPWVSKKSDFSLNEKYLKKLIEDLYDFCDKFIERINNNDFSLIGYAPFSKLLYKLINKDLSPDLYACGAGRSMVSISSEGNLYPCHGFTGNDMFKLGTVNCMKFNNKLIEKFEKNSGNSINKCIKCPISYYCIKRCPVDSYLYNLDIQKPNDYRCLVYKEIFKATLYCYYYLRQNKKSLRIAQLLYNRWLLVEKFA